ncbi:MAG TPA: ABC transporter substrate-binding protein [Microbacterium sp.]|nr:ABC transporter substrate-binding protein [Microbacterium sp.]
MKFSRPARGAFVAAIAALALTLTACGGATPSDDAADSGPQTLRLSQAAPPSNFQIGAYSGGDATIFLSTYDTIVHKGADGSLEPGIAESWEYDESRTKLTLSIREGMTFSSGGPVDAAAVAASLEAAKVGASTQQNFALLSSVEAVDESTVVVTLSQPDAAFVPSLSSTPGAVGDPELLTSEESKLWPVGSGPYTLEQEESTVGSKYVLKKNDEHWNADDYPYETVEVQIIQDPSASQNAVLSGQLDYTGLQSKDSTSQFPEAKFTTGQNLPSTVAALWLVDREGSVVPALADVRVRQAINLALDREAIAKNLNPGTNVPTNQVFSPEGGVYDEELLDKTAYDVEAAKKLLAEAGYADGFEVAMPSVQGFTTTYESAIQQSLADIGITVTWESVPFQDFYAKILGGSYGMFFMFNGFSGSDAQDHNAATNGIFNPFLSAPPEYEELVAAANAASEDEQASAFSAVNEYFVDEAWYAPISTVAGFYAVPKTVDYTPSLQFGVSVKPYQPASD